MTRGGGGSGTSTSGAVAHSELASASASASSSPSPSPHASGSSSSVATTTELALNDGSFGATLATRSGGLRGKLGRQSSKFGTVNYSVDEMRRLNEKVRLVMPLVGEDWLHVAYQFNYMRPDSIPYREVESLKRKFKKMYCSRSNSALNGGKLPDYVQEAKELRRLINQRSEKASAASGGSTSLGMENATAASDSAQDEVENDLENEFKHNGIDVEVPLTGTSAVNAVPSTTSSMTTESSSLACTSVNTSVQATATPLAMSTSPAAASDELVQLASTTSTTLEQPTGSGANNNSSSLDGVTNTNLSTADDPRELIAKLRQLEEEYRQSIQAKRMPGPAAPASPMMTTNGTGADTRTMTKAGSILPDASIIHSNANTTTNAGILSLLRQSIERSKRSVDDSSLSESERVRKERKKRRMEKVLLSIHQEQKEKAAAAAATATAMTCVTDGLSESTIAAVAQQQAGMHPPASAAPMKTANETGTDSLSPSRRQQPHRQRLTEDSETMMELFIQFLTLQHQETMRRLDMEVEQRRLERLQFERALDEERAQRVKDKQEFMVLMASLLDSKFPPELQHYLMNYTPDTRDAQSSSKSRPKDASTQHPSSSQQSQLQAEEQDQESLQRAHGMLV